MAHNFPKIVSATLPTVVPVAACPDDNSLQEFAQGMLPPAQAEPIEGHVDTCSICRRAVSALLRTDAKGSGPQLAAGSLPDVVRIGRFEIAGVLGAGGMGVVYRAYDPELGRQIALKMVRSSSPEATARQKREARAMAQISHANVVAIHDVGTHDGELFLVMELISGTTLSERLLEPGQSWRDKLALFVAAGRGLAAAHAAGLVHRDFKPHNVLVGTDGRARVTDFGLAREQGLAAEEVSPVAQTMPGVAVSPLTSVGRVMGTPAYMAPEQHLGASADARSDQFGFAIALWEALHGERPFAGATTVAIAAEVVAGRLRAPRNRDIPRYVQRAMARGLTADPDQRWPSMDALLRALTTDPRRSLRRTAVAVLGVAAVACATVAGIRMHAARERASAVEACSHAGDDMTGVWDDARAQQVHRALIATDAPFAADAWRYAKTRLDRQATAWRATNIRACTQTRVDATASEAVFAERERCLANSRSELDELVGVLARTDKTTIAFARGALAAVDDPEGCLDASAADDAWDAASPAALVRRMRIALAWPRYARARVLYEIGRYREAADLARRLQEDAGALHYAPLMSRAAGVLGLALNQLGDLPGARRSLTRAVAEAELARDEPTRVTYMASLVHALADDPEHLEEVTRWRTLIDAALPQLPPGQRCSVAGVLIIDDELDRKDPAREVANGERAVAVCEHLDPPDDDLLSTALVGLASARFSAGDGARARADLRRALQLSERTLGPEHPEIVPILVNLSIYAPRADSDEVHDSLVRALAILDHNRLENDNLQTALFGLYSYHLTRGEYGRAWDYVRREHEVAARLHGPGSVRVAGVMADEAIALLGVGRLDEALRTARQAREIVVGRLGENTIEMSPPDRALGEILFAQDKPREALVVAKRTLAGTLANLPNGWDDIASDHALVADLEAAVGNVREAAVHYRAALDAAARDASGYTDGARIDANTGLGELLVAQGKPADAVAPLESALAAIGTGTVNPVTAARTCFALARALWQTGARERALELARRARDDYRRTTFPHARELALVERWLAGKPAH